LTNKAQKYEIREKRMYSPIFSIEESSSLVTRIVNLTKEHYDVYIGRDCHRGGYDLAQSKWANPTTVKEAAGSHEQAIWEYKKYFYSRPDLIAALPELKGLVLGC
jgi:hypothetical protein